MSHTTLFGTFEVSIGIIYIFIAGICYKQLSLRKMLKFWQCAFLLGIGNICNGLYYIYEIISFSKIACSVVYAIDPLIQATCTILIFNYVFPNLNKTNKAVRFIYIIPFFTALLIITQKFHNLFLIFDSVYTYGVFREISFNFGPWGYVIAFYNILTSFIMLGLIIYKAIVLSKKSQKKYIQLFIFCAITIINSVIYFSIVTEFTVYLNIIMQFIWCIIFYYLIYFNESQVIAFHGQNKLIETIPYPIIIQDNNGVIVYANTQSYELYPPIKNYTNENIYTSDFINKTFSHAPLISDKYSGETILVINGSKRLCSVKKYDIKNTQNNIIGSIHIFVISDSLQTLITNLSILASTDKLTQFYNRNYLESQKSNFDKDCEILTLIMCDINNLKKINDNFGHDNGDLYILERPSKNNLILLKTYS